MFCKSHVPTVLITGGAGYIGSHTAVYMAHKGYNVIILDTFRHNQILPKTFLLRTHEKNKNYFHSQLEPHNNICVLKADCADTSVLADIFSNHDIQGVIHFAALIEVGESVKDPRAFYNNNVVKTMRLLECMLDHGVKNFIFSSSCAVYGNPKHLPLTEDHPRNPVSPYGNNKMMVEKILEDFHTAYDLQHVALRYFNAAGAMPEYGLGEQHAPETHIIPLLLQAAHEQKPFYIFGNDYPTKDGSCVRDYLHVWDLAQAHWLAQEHLNKNLPSDCFNLGAENGFTVKEVIDATQTICNAPIKTILADRRAGDPPTLIADTAKARDILGWKPQYSELTFILKTAHTFYMQLQKYKETRLNQKPKIPSNYKKI